MTACADGFRKVLTLLRRGLYSHPHQPHPSPGLRRHPQLFSQGPWMSGQNVPARDDLQSDDSGQGAEMTAEGPPWGEPQGKTHAGESQA